MVNILTNIGYISIDKLKALLGLGQPITVYSKPQTFSATVTHALTDVNNGKSFIMSNFPTSCIIKEIRTRSNFIAVQQIWNVAFINNSNGIVPTDININCNTAQIFNVGDYIYIEDEIAYVSTVDTASNIITVTRGVKGTVASYHNYGLKMQTANDGLRLILFKNSPSTAKVVDRLKVIQEMMSWKGTTNAAIIANDKLIKFVGSPLNTNKYDILYLIDGGNSERSSLEDANTVATNTTYNNTIYVTDTLLSHATGIDVQKQMTYDVPIVFSGGDGNLYGILYIDEKLDDTLYPSGITATIDILVETFYGK